MKRKKTVKILCAVLAALLTVSGVTSAILADCGRLNGYHPLKTPREGQIRVACVGDSVTYGFGIPHFRTASYPAALQKLLGDCYCVNNYGYSGRTASLLGDRPYRTETLCTKSREFAPDIVVILLGANDSKTFNWSIEAAGKRIYPSLLETDLKELISVYQALPSHPKVYVATPLPAYADGSGKVRYEIQPDVIRDEIAKGKYLIMSSHQMATVEEFCTDITILDRSHTVLQGNLNEIKKSYGRVHLHLKCEADASPYIAQAGIEILSEKENEYELKVSGESQAASLLSALISAGIPVITYDLREPSLHEIFVEKVGEEHIHEA